MRRIIIVAALVAVAVGVMWGCHREVRPWLVCYRIYEQCLESVGSLSQQECERAVAAQPEPLISAMVDCTRERCCPRLGEICIEGILKKKNRAASLTLVPRR